MLPQNLKELWILRGKPTTEKLIGNYKELTKIYKEIRQAVAKYYQGKLEPSLFKELTTLKPHDADKIHVDLLWACMHAQPTVNGLLVNLFFLTT